MPSETMPPPGKVSDALFLVRRPAPKAVKQRTPIKRTAPPKRRNYARHKREWLRAYGSRERVEWVRWQPCIICGLRPCDNAHIESGGKGRKADYTKVVPLCGGASDESPRASRHLKGHHGQLHSSGRRTFEADYAVDLAASAADTERRWQEEAA